MNSGYTTARTWTPPRDPLLLDLDGDGLELQAANGSVLFDHNADGIRTGTGWIGADDGILVRDLDGNGSIDTGRELFGVDTLKRDGRNAISGFDALGDLDANADGNFTAADLAWNQVQVWRDLDQNGISNAGELFSLDQLGISRIGLTGGSIGGQAGATINGNRVAQTATFTRAGMDQAVGAVSLSAGSIDLAINPFHRDFTDTIALTDEARALPGMQGSGLVRDLGEAMSLGNASAQALTRQVQAFAAATTRDAQRSLLDGLIADWAAVSGSLVESTWQYNLGPGAAGTADEGRLVASDFTTHWGLGTKILTLHPQGMETTRTDYLGLSTLIPTAEGVEVLRRLNVLEVFGGQKFLGLVPAPTGSTNPTLGSGGGGGSFKEAGPQYFDATLSTVQIGLLNQAYDALEESVYGALVVQTRLKPYLDSIELVIDENGIGFDSAALAVKLESYKTTHEREAFIDLAELNRYALPTLQGVGFEGLDMLGGWIEALPAGSALRAELAGMNVYSVGSYRGSAKDDIYVGFNTDDSVALAPGDDAVYASNAEDFFLGGLGDDIISTSVGDDSLGGEEGNDVLDGGAGNDTYFFWRGSQQDTIHNEDVAGTDLDTAYFGPDIAVDQLWFRQVDNDLEVSVIGTNDRLVVSDWYAGAEYRLDSFRTLNGTALLESKVQSLVQAMASFSSPAAGQTTLPPDYQSSLNTVIAANWQ